MRGTKPALDDYQKSAAWSNGIPNPGVIILDEHAPNSLNDALNWAGVETLRIDDLFHTTDDAPLLKWCNRHGFVLITNNCQDFNQLDAKYAHSGLILYTPQSFAVHQTGDFVDAVMQLDSQYGLSNLSNQVVWIQHWVP